MGGRIPSHDPRELLTVCRACGLPLRVDYDLSHVRLKLSDLVGASTGIDVCPEGGAACSALEKLRGSGFVRADDKVVVFNTGTGLKYR